MIDRLPEESNFDYIKKLVYGKLVYKTIDTEYEDLSEKIFGEGNCYNSSEVRKRMYGIKHLIDLIEKDKLNGIENDDILLEYELKRIELDKARMKLSDQKRDLTKQIREAARWEIAVEAIESSAKLIAEQKPFLNVKRNYKNTDKSAVILFSDWHYGLAMSNFINEYNPQIFRERIKNLTQQTIENCLHQEIDTLHVVLLGDLISSNIHTLLRIQNQVDVITQVQEVSEIIAEMLYEFSKAFKIEVYSVSDNHSRVTADKKESLPSETFCRIIEWYLKTRLKDNSMVRFNDNEFGLEIATFNVYDTKFIAVHGNLDKTSNVVQNLSLMTKRFYDVVCTAHYHHNSSDEVHSTDIVSNPSLCGVDPHSLSLRRTSKPAQKLLIIDKDNVGIKCEYVIKL